jgi:hypothetical protein
MAQLNIYYSILLIVLIVITMYLGISNHIINTPKVNNLLHRIVEGRFNTLLIFLIIALTLTEDLNIGFLLCMIYLIILIRIHRVQASEGFRSGPSPLNCKTYGNSREKTGVAFYPLHDNGDNDMQC